MGSKQLDLDFNKKRWGGPRNAAGRRKTRGGVAHSSREDFPARHPILVTLSFCETLPPMRRRDVLQILWNRLRERLSADFRIVDFVLENTHIHCLCEADGKVSLSRGMHGLKRALAHSINRLFGRAGAVFRERYHARALTTPTEVRNALRYVLNNERHHLQERGSFVFSVDTWVDPFSSGYWFNGWLEPITVTEPWQQRMLEIDPPTRPAQTWLLRWGWRQLGLIAFHEVPGATRATRKVASSPHRPRRR